MHLILDCKCLNMRVLTDPALLSQWVEELCRVVGMTPVGELKMENYPFPQSNEEAISAYQQAIRLIPMGGVQFLGESGIMLHPYPEFNYLYLDIFSCVDFDARKALNFVITSLEVSTHASYLFKRGIDMETHQPLMLIPTVL